MLLIYLISKICLNHDHLKACSNLLHTSNRYSEGGMKTKITVFLVLILFLASLSSSTVALDKSNCMTCHTNDSAIKALYKPPVIDTHAGEG